MQQGEKGKETETEIELEVKTELEVKEVKQKTGSEKVQGKERAMVVRSRVGVTPQTRTR